MYETIKIEKVEMSCNACEDYAKMHSTDPPKIAVMACEGACSKGEIARKAANLVAHRMARDRRMFHILLITYDEGRASGN